MVKQTRCTVHKTTRVMGQAVKEKIIKQTRSQIQRDPGRFKRKGTHAYLWLIHVDAWQRPAQYCKAIVLTLSVVSSSL